MFVPSPFIIPLLVHIVKTLRTNFFCLLTGIFLGGLVQLANAQDEANTQTNQASQLGFTGLQSRANALAEDGQLIEARPLLKELIKRVEAAAESDIELDLPIFLIGTSYIQEFVNSNEKTNLLETLKWYDRLEEEYPQSNRIKEMLSKRIDVLRVLERDDDAITLMRKMLGDGYPQVRLDYAERMKILKDLTQIYYGTDQLKEGLPYFGQLLETSREADDQALAAAASFEALFEAKRIDDAIRLVPILARDSVVRYRPRLNVALLKASDVLVEENRPNDAALMLNLIKTTDVMIDWHKGQVAQKTARMEQRIAFGGAPDVVERLQREIEVLENNLEHLDELPSLRNELLVRRARNYTNTARRYEAFWMFHGLMEENPDHERTEYYHYATFSNALEIEKVETAVRIGETYRKRFPEGEFYSDISGALAGAYRNSNQTDKFLSLAVDFLDTRPLDAVSPSLFAQWASFLIEQEKYSELIKQAAEWYKKHDNPIYEDAIFYWGGLAELQMSQFEDAIGSFDRLLEQYPSSAYAEDGLLRKGAALFYAQLFDEARESLHGYIDKYPDGNGLDQTYFFLGEIEFLAGDFELAIKHFEKASELTEQHDIYDAVAFRIGAVYEAMEQYEEMAAHFEAYISRSGGNGDLTRAVLQLGLAFEYLLRPVDMLALYRKNIEKYASDPDNSGVDALIESYVEKYERNKSMLTSTVGLFDQMESNQEFRKQIVTDRGFLFEHFYNNDALDQSLYNRLRQDPEFTENLVEDLSPIHDIMEPYREQLAEYPSETPESYFKTQLAQARSSNDLIAETRMLMGLYRLDIEIEPTRAYDTNLLERLTPRSILYVADYERDKRLELAEEAWKYVLNNYPDNDATIVAYMRLANVREQDGDHSAALNYLDQIVDGFPGSPKIPSVMLRQGELLTKLDRGREAREKYQYILRVPEWRGILQARALFQIGQSYMAENEYAKAHGFFERTFLGYPHLAEWSARAYLADAEALLGMNAKGDAIKTLEEAVSELPDSAPKSILESIEAKLKELQA